MPDDLDINLNLNFNIDTLFDEDIDFEHYNSNEQTKDELNEKRDEILKIRTQKIITKRISEISDLITMPKKDEQYRIVTTRSFDAISFLQFIIKHEVAIETFITVYSIGKKACLVINELLEKGNLGKCTFLISNIRNTAHREKDNFIRKIKERHPSKLRLIYAFSHTKTINIKTESGNFYNVEGSGNFNNNARIEQYLFENNETVYNFHRNWIENCKYFSANKDVKILDFEDKNKGAKGRAN